jgi:hypothetical protein
MANQALKKITPFDFIKFISPSNLIIMMNLE